MPTKSYIGLSGLPGLDPNPAEHIRRYASAHPGVGIALGDLGHDAAAVLVDDRGDIAFAVEEERLNRSKHFMGLPELALAACREAAPSDGIELAYYLNPSAEHRSRRVQSVERLLGPAGADGAGLDFDAVAATVRRDYSKRLGIRFVDHHLAHAASAFYPSGFERALVFTIDGQGESSSISVYRGDERGLTELDSFPVTSSLGYLYSNVTAYLGFEAIEDEYKVMGLAAYGASDDFRPFFDELLVPDADGIHFTIPSLIQQPMQRLHDWARRIGAPRRLGTTLGDRHVAIAYSLQQLLERTVLRLVEHYAAQTGLRDLCLAGGVVLNCSMNGKLDRLGVFDRIFVQPAANDPGAALGAALVAAHDDDPTRRGRPQDHSSFGPSYGREEVLAALNGFRDQIEWREPADVPDSVAPLIARGAVAGWFSGRMEFGPRALGNRSILADPRDPAMKERLNEVVKKREEFRPFAPAVIAERADEFFVLGRDSRQYRFMNFAVPARPERAAEIPAVVHVNGTARVQVVEREQNPAYHRLIERFGELTGVPVVVNTSFNVRGEPIVCTPADAIRCFLHTGIDVLALGDFVVHKQNTAQPASLEADLAGR